MTIVPDDKDWTWVLERRCAECGFDASSCAPASVPGLLRANAEARYRVLAGPAGELRRRPTPDRWARLEYACHVRDVCTLYGRRLRLMLTEHDPLYPNSDQDETAVERLPGTGPTTPVHHLYDVTGQPAGATA